MRRQTLVRVQRKILEAPAASYRYAIAGPARRMLRSAAGLRPVSWLLARTAQRVDRFVFRASGGRATLLGAVSGLPVIMLTTRGARSGRLVTSPVVAVPIGEGIAVVASNWGRRTHPAWYYNLLEHPEATVTCDGRSHPVMARLATGAERQRIVELDLLEYPARELYRRRARHRDIAVFVLEKSPL